MWTECNNKEKKSLLNIKNIKNTSEYDNEHTIGSTGKKHACTIF